MNYWKLGCNWGKGEPDFYDEVVKKHSIVISVEQNMQKGDIVAITRGFQVVALAQLLEDKRKVTDFSALQLDFVNAKIPFEDWLFVAKSYIFELDSQTQFQYQLQQGICQIQKKDIISKINDILKNKFTEMEMDKYVNLLKSTHNLILTGAPGTGKTYLARQIADAMGAEVEFVQFHPSYDYTDFVEGLRPIQDDNGNVGFERKDGVFKAFCAKALENYLDSKKSLQTLQQEISVRDKIYDFIQKSIDEDTEFETQGTKNKFHIIDSKQKSIVIEIPNNEKSRIISLQKSDLVTLLENNVKISSGGDIQTYFQRKYRTQQDSYTFVLYNILRNTKNEVKQVSLVERKNFVFIIDEINRGEISKIFGELFFSIDPGYRGEKGRVQTQYQNIVEDGDIFKKGFFVPENVYIIGTMNDIDRSVESMDFAMRRRFAWKEVTAEDSMQMLDGLDNADVLKNRMRNLNAKILKIEGLGKAYQIGAAYFKKYELYQSFDDLWNYHLDGLLREYLRGTPNLEGNIAELKKAYNNESDTNNGQS